MTNTTCDLEKQIEELEKQIAYEKKKLDCCAYGKSELLYIQELEEQLYELQEQLENE